MAAKERGANSSLEEELEATRQSATRKGKRDKSLDSLLLDFHADKIGDKYATAHDLATAFTTRIIEMQNSSRQRNPRDGN